ncbi:MAG: hypothetical protein RLZ12_84 [Bacillota bacterium]|jgi:hypothetical protein
MKETPLWVFRGTSNDLKAMRIATIPANTKLLASGSKKFANAAKTQMSCYTKVKFGTKEGWIYTKTVATPK